VPATDDELIAAHSSLLADPLELEGARSVGAMSMRKMSG
jgi:hypothetical protein